MPQFFTDDITSDTLIITGDDARHISKVLRCRPGEKLTLCDGRGNLAFCEIVSICQDETVLNVLDRSVSKAEPEVFVTLYQALPKSDKMDFIAQKATELGVGAIVPVKTRYCVSNPDEKSLKKKSERLERIVLEASKQSGRGIIPKVLPTITFEEAISAMSADQASVLFYEKASASFGDVIRSRPESISIMIGPEGGFDESEVIKAQRAGIDICTMGPRILRCETAPLYALSAIMFKYENDI